MPPSVEIVREALDGFNRADREKLDEMVHPDFEVVSPLADIRGRPYKGPDGAREWGDDVIENFSSFVTAIDSFEEVSPGRVLGTGSARVSGRASGLEYDQQLAILVDVRESRIARLEVFFDPDDARRLARQASQE